ncbi:DOMON-like domain-containing protein [Brevundimonas sp.]|uniref:DOMON-like domain-containing protein n=1 Tax=Brevundimonas sp. TaxID=1871086 RepID=UPI002D25BAA8|nr:DOMON-like domain-containing protein [Brevundimonas sp.]HYD29109.1 DOMON-like domain-containing protein [Brevundimonas sp.]
MILNAALRPYEETPGRRGRSIDASVNIEGRSYVFVTFRLNGFGDGILVPEPSESISRVQVRRQRDFAEAALMQLAGEKVGAVGAASDVGRTDGLWRSTCFEVFARLRDGRYAEFNISSSGEWAAYGFTGYRENMTNLAGPIRVIRAERTDYAFELEAMVSWTDWPFIERIGLSAVIEDIDGNLSYWALAHPPGKPDFHHPDSFALILPPPEPA